MQFIASILVLIVLCLAGCAPGLEKQIVGKWKEQGGDRTIQFFPSGDISITTKQGVAATGTYKWTDSTHLRMDGSGFGAGQSNIAEVKINGDELRFTSPTGPSQTWKRVK